MNGKRRLKTGNSVFRRRLLWWIKVNPRINGVDSESAQS